MTKKETQTTSSVQEGRTLHLWTLPSDSLRTQCTVGLRVDTNVTLRFYRLGPSCRHHIPPCLLGGPCLTGVSLSLFDQVLVTRSQVPHHTSNCFVPLVASRIGPLSVGSGFPLLPLLRLWTTVITGGSTTTDTTTTTFVIFVVTGTRRHPDCSGRS